MKMELPAVLANHRETHPRTVKAVQQFLTSDLLAPSMHYLIEHESDSFWPHAEELLNVFARLTGPDYEQRLDRLSRYTYMYLQTQVAYTRRGGYASSSFDDVREKVYDNAEVMDGYYLDGLYLSQAFWPGHLRINRFFQNEFLKRMPPGTQFLEIGIGHGWFFTEMLLRIPRSKGVGIDISPFSINYTSAVARAREIEASRYTLRQGDALQDLGIPTGTLDASICGEVLEHVEQPRQLVERIRDVLRPGGLAYFSAPAKSDAVDHIYEFSDADKVVEVVAAGGLTPIATQQLRLSDWKTKGRDWDPTVLAMVVARKEAKA